MGDRRVGAAHVLLPAMAAATLLFWSISAGVGLLGGILVAMLLGNPYLATTRRLTHPLLSLSLVGLGAGMDLRVVAQVGLHGVGYTAAGIAACLALGALLGRLLAVAHPQGLLITIGTAICGGSAIAAVVPVLRPRDHEVSVALGTVFLLNSVALFVFPAVGHALHMPQERFGLWAALSIHDTSSVVGAASSYGAAALTVGTTVKLARALWIIPLTVGVSLWQRRRCADGEGAPGPRARPPWFILGFVAAAALTTLVPELRPAGLLVARGARQVLVLTLLLIGANLSRDALRAVGVRPLLHGLLLWAIMATLSLAGIAAGVIG